MNLSFQVTQGIKHDMPVKQFDCVTSKTHQQVLDKYKQYCHLK